MKSAMILTGSGPILVLTSYESLDSRDFADKLAARGITRFIAYEVPVELVRRLYGTRFSVVAGDLSQKDDLRVMDIDGHHVFSSFSFADLGEPVYAPSLQQAALTPHGEGKMEHERIYVKMDEYGVITESSYLPILGSRVTPAIDPAHAPKNGHFEIDEQGVIVNGSPAIFNGRKLIFHGRVSPVLGRTDTAAPTCTWKSDGSGDFTCA